MAADLVVDDWSFGLVFEASDGTFHEEFRRHRAKLPHALGLARRDAAISCFGRTFRGFSHVEIAASGKPPQPKHHPTSVARPLEELAAKLKLEVTALGEEVAAESPRHPVALDEVARFPWWDFEGAFGSATEVGVGLLRAASTNVAEATEAAHVVGASIANQTQLYPVTCQALPHVVTLLEARTLTCRPVLLGWLSVVERSARDAKDATSTVLAWAARLVARELAGAMEAHRKAATECQQALHELKPRLEALTQDPVLGEKIKGIVERLR
ncbi:MAG: hypothetical protein U0228_26115 [Myxococcaceae bacterium]